MISFIFFVSAVGHLEKYSDDNITCHEDRWYENSKMEMLFNNTGKKGEN